MEYLDLAEKQKRLKSWTDFAHSDVQCEALKLKMLASLKDYRNLLAKCWENRAASQADKDKLCSLERELSSFSEEARMTVVGINCNSRN